MSLSLLNKKFGLEDLGKNQTQETNRRFGTKFEKTSVKDQRFFGEM